MFQHIFRMNGETRANGPRRLSEAIAGVVFSAVFFLGQFPALAATCGGHGDPSTMVVTTAWLADHLKDPNIVVLALGTKDEYAAAHIPGSRMANPGEIAPTIDGLRSQLPPMADLVAMFSKLGVSSDSRVILYMSKDAVTSTARAYMTLDAMGLGRQTSILDGGLKTWQAESRPVSTETPEFAAGKLTLCPQSDVVVDVAYVTANLHQPGTQIVDARLPSFYTGAETPKGQRTGHVPGAVNVPFSSLLDDQGKFKSIDTLKAQFAAAGVKSGERVVSYCHIGQQGSVVYFIARYLGYDARLYDGSYEDWSAHAELPVDNPAAGK